MADGPSAFLKLGYCDSTGSGAWGKGGFAAWESDSQQDHPVLEDAHYKSTKGLHIVKFWSGAQSVTGSTDKAPDELKSNGPGLTQVSIDAELTPVGKLYEAYAGATPDGVLVNWKLILFRDKYPISQKKAAENHHWFTITGIAGRIVSLNQGGDMLGLMLASGRMSWYDHDRKQGGKTGWEDHTGKALRPMPTSPI